MPAVRMASSAIISSIGAALGGAVDDAAAGQPIEGGEGQIVADRHRQHQALGLAILGDQRHADLAGLRGAGAADCDFLAVDQNFAADAAEHAEHRQQQFALALAIQAAEADNLAGAAASDMLRSRCVHERLRNSITGGAALGFGAGFGGKTWRYSRPIINCTILVKALDQAGLAPILQRYPNLTFFAPTDAAMNALPPDV